jgi:hypothetical protein
MIFHVAQYQVHIQKHRVEADSKAKAIYDVLFGTSKGSTELGDAEFCEVDEDRGLPLEDDRELADELIALGVRLKEWGLPSIHSVEEILNDPERDPSGTND